ncbi:hypothetical protein B0T14DRAFT_249837 [Immersiella caudata]|uniref:Gag protein n=1 Tax=Immersiella caudata TaxID=314043 RepID=A0AA39WJM5_9PEZI|nr:hypothetical protein B0T14DRAFT_249837 [Immersiella caudata]
MATTTQNVYYKGPDDWLVWSLAFRTRAKSGRILEYAMGKENWPREPRRPHVGVFYRTPRIPPTNDPPPNDAPNQGRGRRSRRPTEKGRQQAGASSHNARASTTTITQGDHTVDDEEDDDESMSEPELMGPGDLAEADRLNYLDAQRIYDFDYKRWKAIDDAKAELQRWVLGSVRPSLLHHFEEGSVEEGYQALERLATPHMEKLADNARNAYNNHLQSIKRHERKLSKWIEKWEDHLNEAEKHNLVDITEPNAWWPHLLKALKNTEDGRAWAIGESIGTAVKAREVDYRAVGAILQQKIGSGSSPTHNRRIEGGFPAFHGAESEESDGSERSRGSNRSHNGNRKSRGKPRDRGGFKSHGNQGRGGHTGSKRPYNNDGAYEQGGKRLRNDKTTCWLCDTAGHSIDRCYFTYEPNDPLMPKGGLPEWFKQKERTAHGKAIRKLIEVDPETAEKVAQAKKKRKMD